VLRGWASAASVKLGRRADVRCMTALPPKAEVHPRSCYVAKVPIRDICTAAKIVLASVPSGERATTSPRYKAVTRLIWDLATGRLGAGLRWQRACREQPSRRAAEKRDELAPPHALPQAEERILPHRFEGSVVHHGRIAGPMTAWGPPRPRGSKPDHGTCPLCPESDRRASTCSPSLSAASQHSSAVLP
jgi:hypothetical protein